MSTNKIKICNLEIQTIKKDIKNIHLGVYPPNGRVRIAAPLKTSDEAIKLFAISKINWIKRQKLKYAKQERESKREFVSGESHYFFGNRYRLNVIYSNSKPRIEIKRKSHIDLYAKPGSSIEKKEKILEDFYREELKKNLSKLVEKWKQTTDVNINEFRIKKMKTKWGTCNPKSKRIWLNLELAKKPLQCSEYVLVHEMMHFKERNHTPKFKQLLNSHLPEWNQNRSELNSLILGHSVWD